MYKHKNAAEKVTILCAADTNVAVDNLLEGLSKAGISCLRLGRSVKIREEFLDRSIDHQVRFQRDFDEVSMKDEENSGNIYVCKR